MEEFSRENSKDLDVFLGVLILMDFGNLLTSLVTGYYLPLDRNILVL